MPNKPKRPRDANQLAKYIVDLSVGEVEEEDPTAGKNKRFVEIGRKGGLAGGLARKRALSPPQRKAIARKAATARWKKAPEK
jgi:hypothetical protein